MARRHGTGRRQGRQRIVQPLVDSHWHEALLLIIAAVTLAGDTWGLSTWWGNLAFVKKHRSLR